MNGNAKVHYLEIVTLNVDIVCSSYSQTLGVYFEEPISELGGAKVATLENGGTLGIRAPMHEAEEPCTRPYYLVADIEEAISKAQSSGAEVLVPPMEIPNRGSCAIIKFGDIQSGFWQV